MAEPTTPEEIIERLGEAADAADANNLTLRHFIQGAEGDQVELDDGSTIPTLRGTIAEIRETAGQRRMVITYSVNDLLRYEMKSEPLFGALLGEAVMVDKNLTASLFRLNIAPVQQVSFEIMIGASRFDVLFEAGQQVGQIINGSEDILRFPRGTQLETYLSGYSRDASQFRLSLELLIDNDAV